MPWSYHKYVGHDINRDAFMLNMTENRTLARFFSREWHPQVFLAMHQMGSNGPRFFVPPNYDPIDTEPGPAHLARGGAAGQRDGPRARKPGQAGRGLERDVRLLLARLRGLRAPRPQHRVPAHRGGVGATREPDRSGRRRICAATTRGLPQYAPQINFPNPWPGGTWRLGDIVDYNLAAMRGLLQAASRYRDELVLNFVTMGRRSIERGAKEGPYAFAIPPDQHDPAAAEQADQPAGGRRRRRAAGVRAVQAGRHCLPGRHGVRDDGAAVPGLRQEPARRAEVPGAEAGWIGHAGAPVRRGRVDAALPDGRARRRASRPRSRRR